MNWAGPPLAQEPLQADVGLLALLACGGLGVFGFAWWLFTSSLGTVPVVWMNLEPTELVYLCEAEKSLVCGGLNSLGATSSRNSESWRGFLLLLQKEGAPQSLKVASPAPGSIAWRAAVHRLLAAYCFDQIYVDVPQVVALQISEVRALDAHILASRPSGQIQQRLLVKDSEGCPGRVLALRMQNLFEVPSSQNWNSTLLSIELCPGCGLQEIKDLPSRHIMAASLASGTHKGLAGKSNNGLAIFSSEEGVVKEALEADLLSGSFRVFLDGLPISPGTELRRSVPAHLQTIPQLAAAASTALASVPNSCHRVLEDLLRLQSLAAGDCEKLALPLMEELKVRTCSSAVPLAERLLGIQQLQVAAAEASGFRAGPEGLSARTKEAQKLLARATWGPSEVRKAERWLSQFLLGRAAMDAKVLVALATAPVSDDAAEKRLHRLRFKRLEATPQSESGNVWARITVLTNLEAIAADVEAAIRNASNELEDLASRYRGRLDLEQKQS